jgi:hypothetical protein
MRGVLAVQLPPLITAKQLLRRKVDKKPGRTSTAE